MPATPATRHCFVTDLFEDGAEVDRSWTAEDCALSIINNRLFPRTVTEIEPHDDDPTRHIIRDATADIAQLVASLRDQNDNSKWAWELLNWLQRNGAVSNAEMAA